MKEKYLYGLDLSLSCTGVTIYDLEEERFVYIGHIGTDHITKKKANKHLYLNALKLEEIYNNLLILKAKYPPRAIAIERGFSRFNTATQSIFRVHGLVNFIFRDIPQEYYPPKEVKAQIIKGTASKLQLQGVINNHYPNIEFNNEDESDSFAVALTYLMKHDIIEVFPERVEPKTKKKKS